MTKEEKISLLEGYIDFFMEKLQAMNVTVRHLQDKVTDKSLDFNERKSYEEKAGCLDVTSYVIWQDVRLMRQLIKEGSVSFNKVLFDGSATSTYVELTLDDDCQILIQACLRDLR